MKKVSILIPLYNQETLIKKCLDSIPNSKNIEIIVVDDCSTDNSYEVASTYPNIRLFKNDKNLGIGLTRNKLLDKAEGEYIFFLDSDDYLYTKEFLEVVDKLNSQVCLKPMCERNDGHKWYSSVHRGDFLKREFIGNTKHPDSRCGEDSCFKKLINEKFGYNEERINKVIYHYNEPRIDSLTWEHRKKKGVRGYDKGIDEWEKVYKK